MDKITLNEVRHILRPQCCAYSTYEYPDFIEIPQNKEELQLLINAIGENSLILTSHEKAFELGYSELPKWSNDNDYLFFSEKEGLLLCLAKSLFVNNENS